MGRKGDDQWKGILCEVGDFDTLGFSLVGAIIMQSTEMTLSGADQEECMYCSTVGSIAMIIHWPGLARFDWPGFPTLVFPVISQDGIK